MRFFLLRMIVLFLAILPLSSDAQKIKADKKLLAVADKYLTAATAQYKILQQQLPADKFPKTYFPTTGKYEWSNSGWWCSGFYPGTLLYLYEATKDASLYQEALRILQLLEKEKNNTTTHDLGFMMFCSFGNANRLQPKTEYNEILLTSAKSLCTRFNPATGCIKSWDSKKDDFLVIIDNMMNLELLFWATRYSGDSSFYKIAVTHANTTLKNHFRSDNSSYHVLNYNSETGAVQQKRTAQGFADASAWARGQAWGLYGYTATYRETKDVQYLQQANAIAAFILNHPKLPSDKIPYWDFDATTIPNALRDASAAAIIASALLELKEYVNAKTAAQYVNAATVILKNLSTEKYRAAAGTNGGFILQHSVGHFPQQTEIDVPLTYADYYYVEALLRYKQLNRK